MEKIKNIDDLVSEKDRHGYVTRDMGSNIQRELGEDSVIKTPGSLLSAFIYSSVLKNRAPQILESCHPGWGIMKYVCKTGKG